MSKPTKVCAWVQTFAAGRTDWQANKLPFRTDPIRSDPIRRGPLPI